MKSSAGKLLKSKREERKISITKAAQEINITSRHLIALEEDNHSVFPGETYTLGFLRSYAAYLDIDPEKVIQLYKGAQLVDKEVPLQELTKPTLTAFDHIQKYMKYILGILIVLVGVFLICNYEFNTSNNSFTTPDDDNTSNNDAFKPNKGGTAPDEETDTIKITKGATTALINLGKGINFSIENHEVFLILKSLKNDAEGIPVATFVRYPGPTKFVMRRGETINIEDQLPRKYSINFTATSAESLTKAKVYLALGERVSGEEPALIEKPQVERAENFKIHFEAHTTAENFVNFTVDGTPRIIGKTLPADTPIEFYADHSIECRIGNAGGIVIRINGKKYNWGKSGQTVTRIIKKVKDPISQTEFKVLVETP